MQRFRPCTDVQGLHSIDSIDGVNMHLQDVPPFLDEDRFERQEFEGMTIGVTLGPAMAVAPGLKDFTERCIQLHGPARSVDLFALAQQNATWKDRQPLEMDGVDGVDGVDIPRFQPHPALYSKLRTIHIAGAEARQSTTLRATGKGLATANAHACHRHKCQDE